MLSVDQPTTNLLQNYLEARQTEAYSDTGKNFTELYQAEFPTGNTLAFLTDPNLPHSAEKGCKGSSATAGLLAKKIPLTSVSWYFNAEILLCNTFFFLSSGLEICYFVFLSPKRERDNYFKLTVGLYFIKNIYIYVLNKSK